MELTNLNKDRKSRKGTVDMSTMIYGKIPPQAKDLEEAVLGAIMLHAHAYDSACLIISPDSFYVDSHQRIFRACAELSRFNQGIDTLTVVEQLKKSEELDLVGGPYHITKLTNSVVSAAHLEQHCRIIQQKFIQRELIRIAGEVMQEAYEDSADAFELLDEAEEKFLSIGSKTIKGDVQTIEKVMMDAAKQIQKWRQMDNPVSGIPTGFPTLDRATRGWQTGLIILAARPSVGKSAIAISLADAATKNPIRTVPVAVFSLEMKAMQQGLRLISSKSGVYLTRIQTGRLEDEHMKVLQEVMAELAKRKIFFDDSPGLSLAGFKAKCRRLKKKHGIGLVIVDYLQLVKGDDRNTREQEISKISREMKLLSTELDLPIIALSQLSREIEKRKAGDKKPQLSDLRESGALEQDADVVVFLWGPEEAEIEKDATLKYRRYARIAKQRDGMLDTVNLEFKYEIQKITEWEGEVPAAVQGQLGQGNWKPAFPIKNSDPNLYIQSGSRMKDDEPDSEMPF